MDFANANFKKSECLSQFQIYEPVSVEAFSVNQHSHKANFKPYQNPNGEVIKNNSLQVQLFFIPGCKGAF